MIHVYEQPHGVSIAACCSDLQGAFVELQYLISPLEQLLTGFQSSQSFLLASAAPVRVTDGFQVKLSKPEIKRPM